MNITVFIITLYIYIYIYNISAVHCLFMLLLTNTTFDFNNVLVHIESNID